MRVRALAFAVVLVFSVCTSSGQSAKDTTKKGEAPQKTDIDPLALQVLKAATEPIRNATSYSFRALVSREDVGTNGQIITLFNMSDVTVKRPDKLHFTIRGRGKEVELFYNGGQSVLYAPEEKLYAAIQSPKNIDAALQSLEQRDVYIPVANFLASDPYRSLADQLITAYVVGKVMLFDQTVHHLAFTEPGAEWQLWVVGGEKPTVRRLQVVDKSKPKQPRVTVDFLDWDLNANPRPDLFTFAKPADAKQIELLRSAAKKK